MNPVLATLLTFLIAVAFLRLMDYIAHRGWIDIKSAVTGKDEGAIVAEAERGEDSAKKAYQDALSQGGILSTQTQALIRQQSSIVHSTHDRVRSLERAVTGR